MALVQPLDLQTILVNILSGSNAIFVGAFIVFLSGLAAFLHMENFIFLILIGLFFTIMSVYAPVGAGYLLVIIIVTSLLVYFTISKIVKG